LKPIAKAPTPTSTVGRGCAVKEIKRPQTNHWSDEFIDVRLSDSLSFYKSWRLPTVIVSDGGYGILGFEGDTSDHLGLPEWYEPHIAAWARYASPQTTLWFWNSEIGWASVHPILRCLVAEARISCVFTCRLHCLVKTTANQSSVGDCKYLRSVSEKSLETR